MPRLQIKSVSDLGLVIRAVRRQSDVRLDDLAATASLSKQFVSDVEHGKPTVQMGRVLHLIEELGIQLEVDIPPAAAKELERLAPTLWSRVVAAAERKTRGPA
jgi:transcriptional regulator with XRE-family HTH domain